LSPKLPAVKARDVVRVATKPGFVFDHQKGSHAVYYDDIEITPEEFQRLLRK